MEEINIKQLVLAVHTIAEEKNLPEETVLSVIEQAIAAAWRRDNGERDQEVRSELNINDGTAVVYLSEDWEAVCFVCRAGRLGWFLLQTKGPRNVAIEPQKLVQIHNAFADAGILQSSMIEAIKRILMTHEWSRRRQARDDDEIFDDIAAC